MTTLCAPPLYSGCSGAYQQASSFCTQYCTSGLSAMAEDSLAHETTLSTPTSGGIQRARFSSVISARSLAAVYADADLLLDDALVPDGMEVKFAAFRSTLLHGERLLLTHVKKLIAQFRSTPQGERLFQTAGSVTPKLFRSTLPQGERRFLTTGLEPLRSFDPRSRRGSDEPDRRPRRPRRFDPRSRRGSDAWSASRQHFTYRGFRSTLPQGERLSAVSPAVVSDMFRSDAPAGGATYGPFAAQSPCIEQFRSTLPQGERL